LIQAKFAQQGSDLGLGLSVLEPLTGKIFGGPLVVVYALIVVSGKKLLKDALQRCEEGAVYDSALTATQTQDIPSEGDYIADIH
jgi:hypothetical protein